MRTLIRTVHWGSKKLKAVRMIVVGVVAWASLVPALPTNGSPTPPKEYAIVFDATALEPPTFWQVPGVTPEMATLDPDSTDALRTEEKRSYC